VTKTVSLAKFVEQLLAHGITNIDECVLLRVINDEQVGNAAEEIAKEENVRILAELAAQVSRALHTPTDRAEQVAAESRARVEAAKPDEPEPSYPHVEWWLLKVCSIVDRCPECNEPTAIELDETDADDDALEAVAFWCRDCDIQWERPFGVSFSLGDVKRLEEDEED
jgi:hypothetical protein